MLMRESLRILLLHSEVRSYRVPIFDLLSKQHKVRFMFLCGQDFARFFPQTKEWRYENLRPVLFPGYGGDVTPSLLWKLVKERKDYDVVISSGLTSFATHMSFLISRLLGKRFITWSEDWVWPKNLLSQIALPYVRFIIRHADACIVAGTKARDFHIQLGATPSKVFIAPNCAEDLSKAPADTVAVSAIAKAINPHEKKVIAYLGRVVEYKNLDALIKAFAELEKERDDVLLLIVGDGPFAPYCRDLLSQLKIKNVVWPEGTRNSKTVIVEPIPREELIRYMKLCDIFVLPGKFMRQENVPCESWGLALNEAMSLGRPVISTTSVAAAFDLIENNKNGFVVKEGSVSALHDALHSVLKETALLRQMGNNARERIQKVGIYERMLQGFTDALSFVAKT